MLSQKALDELERRRETEMETFKRVCAVFLISMPDIN